MAQEIPNWLAPHVLDYKTELIEGRERDYLIVSKELEPSLSRFVGYNGGLPFVSEEVPEQSRTAWVAHEIIEFENYANANGTMQPNHCLRSLEREFEYVAPEYLETHVKDRYVFFCGLVDYLNRNEESPTFISEVTKSSEALEKIIKELE